MTCFRVPVSLGLITLSFVVRLAIEWLRVQSRVHILNEDDNDPHSRTHVPRMNCVRFTLSYSIN